MVVGGTRDKPFWLLSALGLFVDADSPLSMA